MFFLVPANLGILWHYFLHLVQVVRYKFDNSNSFSVQEELQGLGKLSVQYYVTIIVGQQQVQRLWINAGPSGIHLFQLNTLQQGFHILEETHPSVKMRGEKMKELKVQTACDQSHNMSWQEKLQLLKVDLEVNGTDSVKGFFL